MKKFQKLIVVLGVLLLVALPTFAGGQKEAKPAGGKTATAGAGPVNNNPLSDVRVRQAIAYAIDMDKLAKTLFKGMVTPAECLVPPGPFHAPGLNKYTYNPEKARALLKAAKWDSNRVLRLGYYYGDQLTVDFMTAIQAYLADVGIKITFERVTGDIVGRMFKPPADPEHGPSAIDFDLGYGANAALALQEYYGQFMKGRNAYTPWTPKIGKMLDALYSSVDIEKQKQAFYNIERWNNETVSVLPLYYQPMFIYENKRLNRNGGEYGNPQYNYDWGILKWTVPADSNGLHVLHTNGGPVELFRLPLINPGLYIYNKVLYDRLLTCDGNLMPKGTSMAKSYKVSSDGLTFTTTLKDGLTWHDGSPITGEDVRFSIELAIRFPQLHAVFAKTFRSIKGAQDFMAGKTKHISGITVNGNTITLHMAKVDPNILLTFSQFPILPKKYLKDADPLKLVQSPFWQHPIGSGPFKIKAVKMNDYLVMVPFKHYHGGVAKIDQIVCYPSDENDPNVVKNAAAGKLDYAFGKNTAEVQAVKSMSHMRVVRVNVPYTRMIWINQFPKKK